MPPKIVLQPSTLLPALPHGLEFDTAIRRAPWRQARSRLTGRPASVALMVPAPVARVTTPPLRRN